MGDDWVLVKFRPTTKPDDRPDEVAAMTVVGDGDESESSVTVPAVPDARLEFAAIVIV